MIQQTKLPSTDSDNVDVPQRVLIVGGVAGAPRAPPG